MMRVFGIWCYNHISLPYAKLLGLGLDPVVMPWFQELLFKDLIRIILPGFSIRIIQSYLVRFR